MTWTRLFLLLLLAIMLACGQVLFKLAAQSIKGPVEFNSHAIPQLILNPYLVAGVSIYAVATICWVFVLRDTELTKAYLVVALSIVLVSIAGGFVLQEPLSARLAVGTAIILVGLAVALW